jgi:hypothetical protein
MHELITTELLKIAVNPIKQRMYWTMQGFWQEDVEKTTNIETMLRKISGQMSHQGTVVLDTSGLRIMDPHVADRFIKTFTAFLLDNHVKALAHVGDPKNVILKMQFQRVLRGITKANEVQTQSFIEQQAAEHWLDMIQMPRNHKNLATEVRPLDALQFAN